MSEMPYNFARERHEAREADDRDTVRIDGQVYDAADVPTRAELEDR